jgi:hypothetical protein
MLIARKTCPLKAVGMAPGAMPASFRRVSVGMLIAR